MNNKKSNLELLLVVLIMVGSLVVTNPTKYDFMEFVDNELVKMDDNHTVSCNIICSTE